MDGRQLLQERSCVQFVMDNKLAIDITPFPEVTIATILCNLNDNITLGRSVLWSNHNCSQSEGSLINHYLIADYIYSRELAN